MSEVILSIITWALIPMGLLPVVTALVLLPQVNSTSMALKERARLAQVLGFLGASTALVAAFALLDLEAGWLVVLFGLALVAVDVASGIWLFQYVKGRFGA